MERMMRMTMDGVPASPQQSSTWSNLFTSNACSGSNSVLDGGSSNSNSGGYDTGTHVAVAIAVFASGALGVFTPILVHWHYHRRRLQHHRGSTGSIHHNHHYNAQELTRRQSSLEKVLHFGKLFGAGVILGTGFIHMLPAAFSALSNKCLPRLFTEQYTAFTPLIAMMAGLAIHLLEWMAVSHYANIQSEHRELCHGENDDIQLEQQQPPSRQQSVVSETVTTPATEVNEDAIVPVAEPHILDRQLPDQLTTHTPVMEPARLAESNGSSWHHQYEQPATQTHLSHTHVHGAALIHLAHEAQCHADHHQHQHHQQHQPQQVQPSVSAASTGNTAESDAPTAASSQLTLDGGSGDTTTTMQLSSHPGTVRQRVRVHPGIAPAKSPPTSTSSTSSDSAVHHAHAHAHLHAAHLQNIRSRRVSAIILEVGISLHSVLIGIALGVATGTEFRVLALAIAIHQSFEGMALGASITAAEFDTLRTSLLGALLFSLTTPLGVCIGVAIHKLYNENSPAALITQGVMDSVSAGILIYMAYVGLIAEEFSSKPFRKLSRAMKVASFASLYFGAIAMALLGIWA